MGDPGAVEDRPLVIGNRALIADRQRDQHTEIRRIGQSAEKAAADRLAQPFDRITGSCDEVVEPLAAAADAAGGADVAFEQPGLVVKTVGVGVAVRAFEAHGETPTLAGANAAPITDFFAGLVISFASVRIAPVVVPREQNAARSDRRPGVHRFDVEGETLTTLETLRQRGDHASQGHFARLPGFGQGVGKALLRQQSSPGETEQSRTKCPPQRIPERGRRRSECAPRKPQPAQRRQANQQLAGGQFALQLQERDAAGKRDNQKAHANPPQPVGVR